jgi:hypothetical protein
MQLGAGSSSSGDGGPLRAGCVMTLAGLALASLFALMPAVAAAEPQHFTSQVTVLDATTESIRGELRSPSTRCVGGRAIWVAEPGATAPITVVETDAQGSFEIAAGELPPAATRLVLTAVRPQPGRQRACRSDAAELMLDQGTLSGGFAAGAFRGRLSSSIAACVPNRTIELYEISSEPVFVGSNITDAVGDWVLAAAGGTYEARAVPAISGGPDAFVYCRELVSPPWIFEEPA